MAKYCEFEAGDVVEFQSADPNNPRAPWKRGVVVRVHRAVGEMWHGRPTTGASRSLLIEVAPGVRIVRKMRQCRKVK